MGGKLQTVFEYFDSQSNSNKLEFVNCYVSDMSSNYHFHAVRCVEDLVLSAEHKLCGRVAQYLRDFQLDGIRFLYKHFENNESCILNDESGLGKTATVCAFLETVLPHDATRNCLIIVKNDERLKNWKFHLEALTKLSNKVVFRDEDVSNGIVFLTKWDFLQKSTSLANQTFDCVILDNRGELLANKICSGYLLRNYVNKISLIVSSADVAMDLKQFHMMLELCDRLGKTYGNIQVFEEKFSLPNTSGVTDVNLLESYFLRRERIINFCSEFRLRRYRHQYDDVFPLVQPEDYIKSLNTWITTPQSYSKSNSSSVKILSSSSERDVEQLLKSYFGAREKKDIDEEMDMHNKIVKVPNFRDDDDEMPPLLLESDSEERPADHTKYQKSKTMESATISLSVDIQKKEFNKEHENASKKLTDMSDPKWKEINDIGGKRQIRKKRNALNNCSIRTNMRSIHATRSKTQKNKYILFDGHKNHHMTRLRKQKRKTKKNESENVKSRLQKQTIKSEKKEKIQKMKTRKYKSENIEKCSDNKYSTRSRVKTISSKVFDNLDKINKKRVICKRGQKRDMIPCEKLHGTKNNVKSGKIRKSKDNMQSNQKVRPQKSKANNIKDVLKTFPPQNYSKTARTYINESGGQGFKTQNELHFDTPQNDIIVLSSTTDDCTPLSSNNNIKPFQKVNKLVSSPDIFSNVTDDCDILCSQKDKFYSRLISSSSITHTNSTILRSRNSSCLDLLEKQFHKEKNNILQEREHILEISGTDSFDKNFTRLNEELNEVTPIKSRSVTFQKNKITKYLIGSESSNKDNFSRLEEDLNGGKTVEGCPKTPKKPTIVQRNVNTFSKSPKSKVPKDITPSSLRKWLVKSQSINEDIVKPSKRRKLDLWFNE